MSLLFGNAKIVARGTLLGVSWKAVLFFVSFGLTVCDMLVSWNDFVLAVVHEDYVLVIV